MLSLLIGNHYQNRTRKWGISCLWPGHHLLQRNWIHQLLHLFAIVAKTGSPHGVIIALFVSSFLQAKTLSGCLVNWWLFSYWFQLLNVFTKITCLYCCINLYWHSNPVWSIIFKAFSEDCWYGRLEQHFVWHVQFLFASLDHTPSFHLWFTYFVPHTGNFQ